MNKYVYKIGNKEVSREEFLRFVAEECEARQITEICGFGVSIADYRKGEAVTKRMQRRAYADYQRQYGYIINAGAKAHGEAQELYCEVRGGLLKVEYWKHERPAFLIGRN